MSLTVIRGNGVRWSGIVFRGTPFNPVAGEEKFFGVRYFFFYVDLIQTRLAYKNFDPQN